MNQKAVKINKCNKTANINVKKNFQFKAVGLRHATKTAKITEMCYHLGAH